MDIKTYLQDYSQRADQFLDNFFAEKIKEAKKTGDSGNGLVNVPLEMMSMYREFMRGGKKLRGALVQLGFLCGGGISNHILPVSVAMEMMHSFLLMHDDVMDQDSLRRGRVTVHKQWESLTQKRLLKSANHRHLGESLAYTTGDVGNFLAMGIIADSQLIADKKLKAFSYLSKFLVNTGYGQGLDIVYEVSDHVGIPDVLRVHLLKTAHYTISGPLILGGILSNVNNKQINAMKVFGESVGVAFQLRDDELGLFGEEAIIGKTVGSDVREGKNTLLKIKAMELSNHQDQQIINQLYGKHKITLDDIKNVREITIRSGAWDYSQQLTKKLVIKGKKAIPFITENPEYQDTLLQIADYIVARKT